MQERLQLRVPALVAQRLPSLASRYRKAFSAAFGAVATLACVCLLLALAQHAHRSHVTAPSGAKTLTPQAPMANAAPVATPATLSAPTFAPVPTQIFHLALTTQAPKRQSGLPVAAQEPSLPTQAQLDAQALADTQAPSHPAPTFELTAQERQLRLMLRVGERRQLAELNPLSIASRQRRERAESSTFFDPPPPPYPLPLPYIEQLDGARQQPADGKTTNDATTR